MLSFIIGFLSAYLGAGIFLNGVGVLADYKLGYRLTLKEVPVLLYAIAVWPWILKILIEDY